MPGIFDISLITSEKTPVYPGDPEFKLEKVKSIAQDGYDLTKICTGTHIGTHIDAPAHYLQDGTIISDLPLDILIGKAVVFEFTNDDFISAGDLESLDFGDNTRIIFKTKNSNYTEFVRFKEDYVYLDEKAAEYLIKKGIRLIGFDYYTIDKYNSDMPAHKKFLENDVYIVEGLNLTNIEPGEYELLALPVKLNTEGAPARVVLRQFIRGNIPS